GVWFGPTSSAIVERPDLLREAMDDISDAAAHPFAALNAAFFGDGYVLEVAPGVTIDQPIEIVHLGSGAGAGSYHTRSLVTLGTGSRASILESYAGPETGSGHYWRNDVVAVRLAEGAELTRTVIVEESAH